MASNEDVENETTDENILYDLTIHAEWKQENELFRKAIGKESAVSTFGRLTSSTQRAGWTFLRTLGLPIQTASPCYLPPALVKLVNCKINWHIAVSRDGKNVAVLQDQCIEIRSRRDAYETVVGRISIQRDQYPQWRQLVWSPDSSMVACSYSSGVVEVFDIVGTLLFTIPASDSSSSPNLPTDLSGAVVALIFTDVNPGAEWSSELLVINFHGSLRSYKVDRDKGFEFQHSFHYHNCYPLGVSSVVYHPGAGLMYVGGCGLEEEEGSESMKEGLTAWRILSDYPHYKLVTDYSDDLRQSMSQRSLVKRLRLPSLNYFKKENRDGVYKMSLSPGGKHLAVVHLSGKFSLWNTPSLKLMRMWDHSEQPYCGDLSPEFTETPHLRKQLKDLVPTRNLIDVNWWSDEAVILARCTGAVTVSSIKTLKNLLGTSPEWLEPAPHVGPVHDGGFLGLEVECRFPSKRRLMIGDEDNEDDSEEDESVMTKTTRYSKQVLHYVTDMERFQPPKKKPKLVNRTYRLVFLKSTTPEELYARKLDNEEYGEAKALAEAYGLDCDLVYQRQWRKSPVEIASIQDYLSKISKRSWVLHECLERMSDSIDAMKELLEFGLRGTDLPALIMIGKGEDKGRFILCDEEEGLYEDLELSPYDLESSKKKEEIKLQRQLELLKEVNFDNLTLEQRELCKARKKLVQYLYRLKTYECILGGVNYAAERFDSKFFEKFRSQNIVETAVQYAQSSDWKALDTLFTFHSEEVMPHRLAILSNFPETTSPAEYKVLLPEISEGCVLDWETERWHTHDWVERDPCRSAIEQSAPDQLGQFLYEQQPELSKYRNATSHHLVTQWYKYRAFEIERLSRQADFALELVKLGVERGVQGLDTILDDLVTMEMLVYDCHIDDSLTFEQLRGMADYDKLELIMKQSSDEMYSKNLRKWLVPFLRQCEQKTPGSYNRLIRDYVVTMAKTDLSRPLKVFELSKTHLGSPIILTQTELMSIAIEALYGCERADQLDLAMEVLKCLPQRGVGTESREVKKLHEQVDQIEHHLNAARILEENGIKKPVYFIKDTEMSPDEAEQLMIKLTRMAGRRDPPLSEAQWSKLHGDVIELQNKVYRCISQGLCHEIFVESLLCSNDTNNINLAGKLIEQTEEESRKPTPRQYNMQTRVPYNRAIELVLEASREYFNSAANLTDQCMILARCCLNLIRDSPAEIQEENDLIASLSLLEEFGVKILPLQVRLCKDRLALVKNSVQSKPGAYKQKQKFVRLGHLLRVGGSERTEKEGKVLHLVAKAALQSEDYQYCYDICAQLIDWGHGAAWDVCVDLAKAEGFHNLKAKVELLSFAVTYCSVDMIEPVLQARTLLETQVLYEGLASETGCTEDRSSRISPFSARAALQQTQHILRSTKDTTKAVLSTVTDAGWWQGTIHRLKQPTKQISRDYTDRNKKLELQSCHPFYDGIIQSSYSDVDEADLANCSVCVDRDVELSERVLRTAQLEELLTQGDKSQATSEVLLQLADEAFPTDNTLSLAYLLALQTPTEADRCFEDHPKTDISLQLAIYYYALQIYSSVRPCNDPDLHPLYSHPPVKVMQKVVSLVTQKTDFDWPEEVKELVGKIKQYNEMLEDYRQAILLRKLGRGIDVERFAEDAEYKQETILGLAMSLEDNIYGISVSLAERYEIPLWQVYAAHLEFLFSDSGLSTEEVESRVSKLDILSTLKSQPGAFCTRLQTYIYPTLEGRDHARLLYYYSIQSGCDVTLEGGLTADAHVKLLKRVKTVMPDLDYKAVMVAGADVMTELAPCLNASNVNNSAKLAKQLPDGSGGVLDASSVYCVWVVKLFWDGDGKRPPDNMAAWLHRYEACGDYIQKLSPGDVVKMVDRLIFTTQARQQLDVDCRLEICRRVLKFCRQNINKKKRTEESRKDKASTWEEVCTVLECYREHLERLKTPIITSLNAVEVDRVQNYLESYDLSKGCSEEIHNLLVRVLLDGEESLDFIQDLLSVCDTESWTLVTVIKQALALVLEKLTNSVEASDKSSTNMEPLPTLKHIIECVQAHSEHGGDLVSSEDILLTLRPFCSDSTLEVQPRLDVLHILEQNFKLSEEDSRLLTLYRTQAVVMESWHDCQIVEKDIKTSNSQLKLFKTLLEKTSSEDFSTHKEALSALCRLLQLWPPFPGNILSSVERSPWVAVFKAMIHNGYHGNTADVIATVQRMPDPGLTKTCTEAIYSEMLEQSYVMDAIKLCLVVGHTDMFPPAIDVLSKLEQEITDSKLLELILKHKLVPSLVQSAHYPIIIEYLLANQDPDLGSPDHFNIERLANQLLDSGFDAEAGSLLLHARATHSMLHTFGSALGAIGHWLKK